MNRAQYQIERIDSEVMVIRDLGPWDRYPTVTNDAEGVVQKLHEDG